jgi:hypothetical protein
MFRVQIKGLNFGDVTMVPSSVITIVADGQLLTCSGFFLSETIHLGSFKFISNYFGGLGLSPRRGDSSAAFMGSTHSGTPSPWWAMIEDSIKEFLIASSGEGGSALFSPRRCGTGPSSAPITTTPWMENAPGAQAMMMLPQQMAAPRSDNNLPSELRRGHQEGQ